MKRLLVTLGLTVLLVLSSVAGAQDKLSASEIVEGFQLTLDFPTNQFRQGELVKVAAVLRNTTEDSREFLSATYTADDFEWIVSGPGRRRLERLKFSQQGRSSRPFRLAGNGEQRIEVVLNLLFDFSQTGEYVVTAARVVPIKGTEVFKEDYPSPGFKWLTGYEQAIVRSDNYLIRITASATPREAGSPSIPGFSPAISNPHVTPQRMTVPQMTELTPAEENSFTKPGSSSVSSTNAVDSAITATFRASRTIAAGVGTSLAMLLIWILWRALRRK